MNTVTPDAIPSSVTRLVYTDPSGAVLSQHQAASIFTHYWPEIEQHFREQVAREIEAASLARLEGMDEDDLRPSHWERHQEWCDAAAIARRTDTDRSAR